MAKKPLPLATWADPGKPDLKGPDTYTASDLRDMPLFYMQRQDVWRKADAQAKALMRDRSIELFAQSMNGKDEHNMRQLARRYPDMSPGMIQGLAQGSPWVLPDGTTAQPFSDQGDPMIAALDHTAAADAASAIAGGTYGATTANPAPQALGLGAINIAGLKPPDTASDYPSDDDGPGFFTNVGRQIKGVANVVLNGLGAIPETLNAASETSAGNEAYASELARRANMSVDQAKELFGNYSGSPVDSPVSPDPLSMSLYAMGRFTTDIDPEKLVSDIDSNPDSTIPKGDITFEEAKQLWRRHLIDSEQLTEDGQKSYGNITGRTTLGQQLREDGQGRNTLGQGGWFGGAVPEAEKARLGLAGRQSDIRSFAERKEAQQKANLIRQQWKDAGLKMSLDDYTLLTSPRTWTEGRAITQQLGMDPGSVAEMALSGSIDLAVTLGTDPSSYVPAGLVKSAGTRGLNIMSRAATGGRRPLFEIDEMMRVASKGDDLTALDDIVGPTARPNATPIDGFTWQTAPTGGMHLTDEAGNVVGNTPRLTKVGMVDQYFGGFKIARAGGSGRKARWKVTDRDGIETTFRTRKEARQHVTDNGGQGRKTIETWQTDTGETGQLGDLMTARREKYLQDEGIAQSRVIMSQTVWDWLTNSVSGTAFTKAVANMDSAYEIRLRSGFKIPMETAERLANSNSIEEVRAVMGSIIGTRLTDPKALKNFSGIRAHAFNGKIKLAEKSHINRMYKAFSMAPKAVPVDMTDLDEVADTAHRFGTAIGMKPSEIKPYVDRMVAAKSNYEVFNTFHDDFIMRGAKDALLRSGVDEESANELLRKVKDARKGRMLPKPNELKQTEMTRTGAIEQVQELMAAMDRQAGGQLLDSSIADGTFIKGLDDEVALFAHEIAGSHLVLPTVRELRREMNKVGQILKSKQPGDLDVVTAAQNLAAKSLDTWRNLTLMNVSYIFRNIAEEIVTMGLLGTRGMLTNPFHAIATVMAMHSAQEYSTGFKLLRNATDRAIPFKRAIRQMRYRPEKYEGSRLVQTSALRNLITDAQGDEAVRQITAKQAKTAKGRNVDMESFLDDVKRGIVNPIEVTVDYNNGRYAVSDGVKRLLAAFDNDIDEVPVRIKAGVLDPTAGRSLPNMTKTTRKVLPPLRNRPNAPRRVRQSTQKVQIGDDLTHKDLWGSAAGGTLEDVQNAAQEAVHNQLGIMRALRYVFPYFDHNMAFANGESYFGALERAVKTGDTRDVPKIMQFVTRLYGSALQEEHPDKIASLRRIFDSSGQQIKMLTPTGAVDTATGRRVPLAPDSQAFTEYVQNYTNMLGELASDRMTREYLTGRKTLDELTREIVDDPRKLQDVLGTLGKGVEDTLYRVKGGAKVDMLPAEDIVRYHSENAYDAVRGVLQENLRSVGKYLGDGTSPIVRKIVEEGQYKGKPLNARNRALRRLVSEELQQNSSFLNAVPAMQATALISREPWNRLTTKFFSAAGNIRDMITLHPFMRDTYVEEITRLAKYLSPDAKQKMVKDLRLADDPALARRIEGVRSAGWMDVETAHDLADIATRKAAEKAFYNAAERRNWAVALRWASPFAQAAVNSTYRWGTAMARDPIATYRTARALNGMKAGIGEWVGHYEPELEDQMGVKGTLDRNQFGDQVFIYPLVGKLARWAGAPVNTGGDPVAAAFTSQSVNVFQTGFVTGFGPAALFAIGSTPLKNAQTRNDVIGDAFRFFQQYSMPQSKSGDVWTRFGETFIPAKWMNILNVDDEQVSRMSQAILVSRLSRNEYGPLEEMTPEQAKEIGQDLDNDSRRLLRLESILKLTGPLLGSFNLSPLMYTDKVAEAMPKEARGKAVLDFMINAEYQAYVGDATGDERTKRMALFMKDYGKYLPAAAQSRTAPGNSDQPVYTGSGNVTNFAYEEPKLYDRYRNTIGYLFPEGDYESQWSDYDQFLRERDKQRGILKTRTPVEQIEFTRQFMMRYVEQERIQQAVQDNPEGFEDDVRAIKDEFDFMEREGYDPTYRNFQMGQIERAVNDPEVLKNVKSATFIRAYFKARQRVVDHIRSQTDSAGSLDSEEAWTRDDAVQQLYRAGVVAAGHDDGFAHFWVSLADDEFGEMPQKHFGTGG